VTSAFAKRLDKLEALLSAKLHVRTLHIFAIGEIADRPKAETRLTVLTEAGEFGHGDRAMYRCKLGGFGQFGPAGALYPGPMRVRMHEITWSGFREVRDTSPRLLAKPLLQLPPPPEPEPETKPAPDLRKELEAEQRVKGFGKGRFDLPTRYA
jgi:hypothetical protein